VLTVYQGALLIRTTPPEMAKMASSLTTCRPQKWENGELKKVPDITN